MTPTNLADLITNAATLSTRPKPMGHPERRPRDEGAASIRGAVRTRFHSLIDPGRRASDSVPDRVAWRVAVIARRLSGLLLAMAVPANAAPTPVTVRVISQDAKFVGDHTGGAGVVLRDVGTGAVLAEGRTQGGTGDTDLIMRNTGRSPRRVAPGTAAFETVIEIDHPTLVRLEVLGPRDRPESAVRVTAERWLMPGEPVTAGDGWVIELPGLAITPTITATDGVLTIAARVEPLCGCPIVPGGLWPAEDYRVSASLWSGKRRAAEVPLAFTTAPGGYTGSLPAPAAQPQMLVIFARNLVTGATGLSQVPITGAKPSARP